MKKLKLLLLMILIVLTCSGCTIEYNINITKDNVEEIINVNDYITSTRTRNDILKQYNMWYPTFVNYIPEGETIEIEDFSEKVSGIEYHEKNISETNDGYKYTYKYIYQIDEYYDSYALASTFIETTIHQGYSNLVIKTGKENLLCQYDNFDSVKINITIDPAVYKLNYTNTSNISNNTYTWLLDRNNCKDSEIILTLDTINKNDNSGNNPSDNNQNNKNNNNSDYIMYIFVGALAIIIFLIYKWFNKLKEKNNKIDDDN